MIQASALSSCLTWPLRNRHGTANKHECLFEIIIVYHTNLNNVLSASFEATTTTHVTDTPLSRHCKCLSSVNHFYFRKVTLVAPTSFKRP